MWLRILPNLRMVISFGRRDMQSLLNDRVAQTEPQLQEVDAQHGFHRKRWATTFEACAT